MQLITNLLAGLGSLALASSAIAGSLDAAQPDEITFGSSVAAMRAVLEPICATLDVRAIDPSPVPDVDDHKQIDCTGFDYFGAGRLAEFVFLNDELKLVWILVEPGDLDALDAAFEAALGEAQIKRDSISLWTDAQAGVRRDVPEALFYASDIAPMVEAQAQSAP